MSQQEQVVLETKPWVLVSTFQENISENDLERISPLIQNLVDEWHATGKIMWTGAFNDNKTAMSVFEANDQDAKNLFDKYNKICNGVLACYLYQWDAMPILSLLSRQ